MPLHWTPRSEGRASEAHRQGARAVAKIPDGGAKQTAGMRTEVENDQDRIPRARVPVGMVHHPAGTSRATGQAEASSHGDAAAGPYARSNVGRIEGSSRRPSPPCQRDGWSGKKRRTGRRKEPHYLLRQVASGASSETSLTDPEGDDPDRRRRLGFLTASICQVATRREFADTSADPRDGARG